MRWKAGGQVILAVADASSGEIVGRPVATEMSIDNLRDFVPTPGGDVIWAYLGEVSAASINRVTSGCRGGSLVDAEIRRSQELRV